MRDGDPECRLRLNDRVRWTEPPTGFEEVSLAGVVIGLKRRFPQSPDLAIDLVHIRFDELTLDGSHHLWVDSTTVEAVEDLEPEGAREAYKDIAYAVSRIIREACDEWKKGVWPQGWPGDQHYARRILALAQASVQTRTEEIIAESEARVATKKVEPSNEM